jgi:hypothetical protein
MSQRLSPGRAAPSTDLIGRYDIFSPGYGETDGPGVAVGTSTLTM